jgi:hypothetical protein
VLVGHPLPAVPVGPAADAQWADKAAASASAS